MDLNLKVASRLSLAVLPASARLLRDSLRQKAVIFSFSTGRKVPPQISHVASRKAERKRNLPRSTSANSVAVAHAFAKIAAAHNRLDILVNAAGVLSTGLVADLPIAEWQRVSEINLSGVIYCAKAAIPFMKVKALWPHHQHCIGSAMRGGGSVGNTLTE